MHTARPLRTLYSLMPRKSKVASSTYCFLPRARCACSARCACTCACTCHFTTADAASSTAFLLFFLLTRLTAPFLHPTSFHSLSRPVSLLFPFLHPLPILVHAQLAVMQAHGIHCQFSRSDCPRPPHSFIFVSRVSPNPYATGSHRDAPSSL